MQMPRSHNLFKCITDRTDIKQIGMSRLFEERLKSIYIKSPKRVRRCAIQVYFSGVSVEKHPDRSLQMGDPTEL